MQTFDTLNHDILLSHLRSDFGVEGAANQLFQSHLMGRQQVRIGDSLSKPLSSETGVQGSGGDPQLYNKYSRLLGALWLLLAALYHVLLTIHMSTNPSTRTR